MNIEELYEQKNQLFFRPSPVARGGLVLCYVLGALGLGYGFFVEPVRAWGAFLFNLFFFFSLALGGIAFGAMQEAVGAQWGRPIKRLHESFACFLPVATFLFVVFLACISFDVLSAREVYRWIKDPSILDHFWGKNFWLQESFMIVRDLVALFVILALAMWQFRQTLRRDLFLLAGKKMEAIAEGKLSATKLRYWSAPILVVYALCFSLLTFDLTMSLAPTWFSTLWGGWSFAIMMQTLMAATLLFMFSMKESPVGQFIARQQFHDVGKLMHGFTIFFAYLTYAHVLTYWYGNVPEETEYFLHRLHSPWLEIVIIIPVLAFVIPLFALLPKISKWTGIFAIPLSALILTAQWFTYLLVVMPEVVDGSKLQVPLVIELGIFFGFLGLFLTVLQSFGKRYPLISIADPMLPASLSHGH